MVHLNYSPRCLRCESTRTVVTWDDDRHSDLPAYADVLFHDIVITCLECKWTYSCVGANKTKSINTKASPL